MKKITAIIVLSMAILTGLVMADNNYKPQALTVGLTSTMIIPAIQPNTTNEWASETAISYGDYIRTYLNGQERYFWCVDAGTSATNEPTWSYTSDTTNGTVIWRSIDRTRRALYIGNDNTGSLYLGWGTDAVANQGYRINASGGSYLRELFTHWQGEVYGISPAGVTNTVLTQELP